MLRRVIKDIAEITAALRRGETGRAESILHRNRGRVPAIVETAYRIMVSHAACNTDRLDKLFRLADRQMEPTEAGGFAAFYRLLIQYFTEVGDMEAVLWLVEKSLDKIPAYFGQNWTACCNCLGLGRLQSHTDGEKRTSIIKQPRHASLVENPSDTIMPDINHIAPDLGAVFRKTA